MSDKNVNDKGPISNSFKAFEALVMQFKMFWHMILFIFVVITILQIAMIWGVYYITDGGSFTMGMNGQEACVSKIYVNIKINEYIGFDIFNKDRGNIKYTCEGSEIKMPKVDFLRTFGEYAQKRLMPKYKWNIFWNFLYTAWLYVLAVLMIRKLHKHHDKETKDKFLRGKIVVKEEEFNEYKTDRMKKGTQISINKYISIPESVITRHNFIIGKPGSGKSQFIVKIIDQLIENGAKIIIHDFKGDFIPAYYNPDIHYIFNPVDSRHMDLNFDNDGKNHPANYWETIENRKDNFVKLLKIGQIIKDIPPLQNNETAKIISIYMDTDTDIMGVITTKKIEIKVRSEKNQKEFTVDISKIPQITKKCAIGWTIFNEIHTLMDIDAFATSIVPPATGEGEIWATGPRDIFKAILIWCMKKEAQNIEKGLDMTDPKNKTMTNAMVTKLLKSGAEELKKCFADFPEDCAVGEVYLQEEKMSGQMLSLLSAKTSFFNYLNGTDGDFSIKEWTENDNSQKRIIFIANQAMVQDTLRPLIATFFDFATKAICSMKDDVDGRRIYFILDEFGQLSKIGSIVQLLTQARSKGGAAFLLIQDQAQIEAIYGAQLVKSIVNSCGNKFYFAVGDETTAEAISKELGTREILRNKESKSFGVGDFKDTISQNADITEVRVALTSEILTLESLTCWAQITDLPLVYAKIEYSNVPYYCQGFIERRSFRVAQESAEAAQLRREKELEAAEYEKIRQETSNPNKIFNSILDPDLESDEEYQARFPEPEDGDDHNPEPDDPADAADVDENNELDAAVNNTLEEKTETVATTEQAEPVKSLEEVIKNMDDKSIFDTGNDAIGGR